MKTEKTSCPCKRLPLCLSSFTAAEYGDLHTLSKAGGVDRQDPGGYTPLYLAAQNGHVAATAFLLKSGARVDGTVLCGATPLHRASFSGAVGTMRLLIDHKADLLATDTSFGDRMTPLHKATAGGRHLAVQLLVEALRLGGLLEEALGRIDSAGRTPLEVSQSLQSRQDEERMSVKRWDIVASVPADWDRCSWILQSVVYSSKPPTALAPLPDHLSTRDSCLNCGVDGNGQCLTASWEVAFRSVLISSIEKQGPVSTMTKSPAKSRVVEPERQTQHQDQESDQSLPPLDAGFGTAAVSQKREDEEPPKALGKKCGLCGETSFALFRSQGSLVCRSCLKQQQSRH